MSRSLKTISKENHDINDSLSDTLPHNYKDSLTKDHLNQTESLIV